MKVFASHVQVLGRRARRTVARKVFKDVRSMDAPFGGGYRSNLFSSARGLSSQPSRVSFVTTLPPPGSNESPYNLLFLPGGWESEETFSEVATELASEGFESSVLTFVKKHKQTVSGQVGEVARVVQELGPFTIIVAYSISGFIAQRFLESNACAGLVLVNSLPPNPKQCLHRLVQAENNVQFKQALDGMKYSGMFQSLLDPPTVPAVDKLIGGDPDHVNTELLRLCGSPQTYLISDIYSQLVNLEPGAVPTLILQSELDDFIGEEDARELASFHSAELQFIPGAFHVTTLNKKAHKKIVGAITEWIERVL